MSVLIASTLQQAVRRHQQGEVQEAIRLCRNVLALEPRQTDAMNLLGVALAQAGQVKEAEKHLRQALALRPRTPPYLVNLGSVLVTQRRFADAVPVFREATRLQPDLAEAWSSLGNALRELGKLDQAEEACRKALQVNPGFGEAHANLGNALRQLGRAREAADCYGAALRSTPATVDLLMNYNEAMLALGDYEAAERLAREALRLAPADPLARYAIATFCLISGRDAEGWAMFEARDELPEIKRRSLSMPRWTGEATQAPILVHAEQGVGDTIQFCRFVAEAAKLTRVILEAPPALHRLFETLDGPEAIVSPLDPPPPVAAHLPLMSLPFRLGIDRSRLAETTPYLSADPALRERWRARLAEAPGRRIGIAWAGNPAYLKDHSRSIPFALLAPLLAAPDTCFVSLQKGDARAQIPAGAPIRDWTDEIGDFADTAALVAELDLVVSVDTAVAHLAGALGHPVWLLNRFNPDWRWGLGTDDSIWYPTLRQFRQPGPEDWPAVIAAVVDALDTFGRRVGA
ncbi:MAG: tetratricopeptide repeat protein [Caulobacteraceae bacterium]